MQWNSQPTVTFNYLYGVSFTDSNTGTAVGYQNPDAMILRTTDGGNSWVRQNSGVSDPFAEINLFGVHFINSNIGTIVGQDGIILRTTDGGDNWDQQTSNTTDWLYAVHSATKITALPSAFSTEQLSERPMEGKTGLLKPARQQASSEFFSSMPMLGPSLAMTV
jgi:hypothetical protein